VVLNAEIKDLKQSSFAPRMEALNAIEEGIQAGLEDIAISEEKLEV